jgi:hypothetical protein
MKTILKANESIKIKKAANLFRGFEGVGGFLFVTNQKLIFEPHTLNIQRQPLEIDFKDIAKIKPRYTLYIISNGVSVIQKNGTEFKFVVWGRTSLITLLKSLCNIP